MKYTRGQYQVFRISLLRLALSLCFVSSHWTVFSQQDEAIDTVMVVSDSLNKIDTTEEAQGTVEETAYNYYYTLEDWNLDSFTIRQVPDSVIRALKEQDEFWYADRDFKKKYTSTAPKKSWWGWLAAQKWYRVLAWTIVIGGFLAVMIWYLASSNVRFFTKKSKAVSAEEDQQTDNIFEINFQPEINKAVKDGNYRLAVRLYFLRLLRDLAERNIIQYQQDRTNFDYLVQLGNSHYYKGFFRVARHYEYTWYGRFTINEDLFTAIKKDFESIDTQVQKN